MNEFFISAILSVVLVIVSTIIYYEVLRITWKKLPKFKIAPRKRIIAIVIAIFFGHTLIVWVYGISYWLLSEMAGLGGLGGAIHEGFFSYIYFSVVTYSSLGFGDVYPTGVLRLLTGVEVLNGLVLIGWSVSFTYLAMQKFWDLH